MTAFKPAEAEEYERLKQQARLNKKARLLEEELAGKPPEPDRQRLYDQLGRVIEQRDLWDAPQKKEKRR